MSRRLLIASGGAVSVAPPTDPPDPDPTDPTCLAFLFAGQSNMVGFGGGPDTGIDVSDPRILCWPASGPSANTEIIEAVEPLPHPSGAVGVGPGMPFARALLPTLPSNHKILLVPRAVPGTGLVEPSDHWDPAGSNNLYTNAILQTNNAMAAADLPVAFGGILWLQGERDSEFGLSPATYAAKLDLLVAGFRAGIDGAEGAPFIVLGMVPEFTTGTAAGIRAVHADTPNRVANSVYVAGPTGYADGVHYLVGGLRILGAAAHTAYATLV